MAQAQGRSTMAIPTSVSDLPVSFIASKGVSRPVTAVLMTGDGGWADLVSKLADRLAESGMAVVGFNSRAWLSSPRTPEETARAIVRAIDASRGVWPSDRIVLVGYSRGADFAPFVASRLPERLRDQLEGVAMFGLAPMASFEFHWSDLVKDTRRSTDVAILPELEKLRAVRMVCVYGSEEPSSGCRDAPTGLLTKDERSGGHHFDSNVDALMIHINNLLKR